MNISILDSCVGCGACAIINPEVFDIQDAKAVVNSNKISATEDLCIDAAITCPVNAIELIEY
ncbi:MAG: ferredoxin [Cyanobacteria bacterium SIG26]|nr:ferredoxin [Cyanobacteria bacterium SIG26]